ncbi:E-selectin-like [Dysidea avara]|uniref:E-selectin-like n=1 Tax=Dysidea avara TaxID=196820 RepID=UPI003323C22D
MSKKSGIVIGIAVRQVTCPTLTAPDNGGIDCSLEDDGEPNPGDVCVFMRDEGYELTAVKLVEMMGYGVEMMLLVQSQLVHVTCPPLTAPDNGGIDCSLGDDGECNPGDVCVFICDEEYHLTGSDIRTCGEDGNCSGTDTACERPAGTCPPLTAPDNGDIDREFGDDGFPTRWDACTFTCDPGFELYVVPPEGVWLGGVGQYGLAEKPNVLKCLHVHHLLLLIMELLIVYWELME